jgi:hypothetical protein
MKKLNHYRKNEISDDFLKSIGDGKLLEVQNLEIKFINFSGNSVRVEVWIENKVGKFLLYPNIDHNDAFLSVGQSLNIGTNKNFKIKSRLKVS